MKDNRFPESVFAPDGIHVAFVSGVRIGVPPRTPTFRYKLSDADTGEVYDYGETCGEDDAEFYIFTQRKYFVRWKVEFYRGGKWYFQHTFDAAGRKVMIDLSPGALGDSAAWLPAAVAFNEKWKCRTIVCMRPEHIPLYQNAYPEIIFIPNHKLKADIADRCYACYRIAVHGYGDQDRERMDFRENNLIRHADMILGVDSHMEPPRIVGEDEPKVHLPAFMATTPRYVCIATRASRKCKEWNHDGGWENVAAALKDRGYQTVCIDADDRNLPAGAIDNTGKIPLPSRIDVLKGCSFFIGLPSGLAWLAWACRKPVVMISGFTDAYVEFATPYRVSPPPGVCHGCWGYCDQREKARFDECYFGKDNECTRSITPEMVIAKIDQLIRQEAL